MRSFPSVSAFFISCTKSILQPGARSVKPDSNSTHPLEEEYGTLWSLGGDFDIMALSFRQRRLAGRWFPAFSPAPLEEGLLRRAFHDSASSPARAPLQRFDAACWPGAVLRIYRVFFVAGSSRLL